VATVSIASTINSIPIDLKISICGYRLAHALLRAELVFFRLLATGGANDPHRFPAALYCNIVRQETIAYENVRFQNLVGRGVVLKLDCITDSGNIASGVDKLTFGD